MTSENKVIEQLWYTWSDVGIDTIRAGFRIRAASEGLRNFRDELVQRLAPYQEYSLPRDADRSIDPKIAPICLALINTGKERILVHKAYTGRDGVGRYGAFFIHLLENLPQDFSLLDAISLWQSPFWQRSDVKDRNTELPRVSLTDLRQPQAKKRVLDQQTVAKIRKYLPAIIETYLTKNLLREKAGPQMVRQKIYIAASDNDVAQLISGLAHSLPAQLVKDLTFSTYEHDITKATTEIVGTCWLSVLEAEKDPIVAHLLPAHYYQEKLTFNCYTGMCSPLVNHPQVLNHPVAAHCAHTATEYFLNNNSSPRYQYLLKTVTPKFPVLSVNEFLEFYKKIVIIRPVSQSDVESTLRSRTLPECEIAAMQLSIPDYWNLLIYLVLNVPNWWATYEKALINLRQQSIKVPILAQALTTLAQRALLPHIVDTVKSEIALLAKTPPPREVSDGNEATFQVIADVMYCAAPPKAEPDIWRSLLKELLNTKHISHFFQYHWSIYTYLLKTWSSALSPSESEDDNKLISNLFTRTLSWVTFGDFLRLRLPLDWVEIATQALVFQSSPPSQKSIYHLGQKYQDDIEKLLEQLSQNTLRWPLAMALFSALIAGTYQNKMSLLSVLLDSPIGNHESTVNQLLQTACSTTDEIGEFFQGYGEKYIPLYPESSTLIKMFDSYARSKMKLRITLLDTWLKCNLQENILTRVLDAAHLTSDERVTFLQYYGKHYLSLYPQSPFLASYVQEFLNFLGNTNIAIFRGSQSPEEPSATEKFLLFLYNSSLLYVSRKLVSYWYNVARFVRQPSLLKKKWENITPSISQLLNTAEVQLPMRTGLIRELAVACIVNEKEAIAMTDSMRRVLTLPDMLRLFDNIAESASDGIYQRQYAKTLYVPCIQSALEFQAVFHHQAEQESFVKGFLDRLLENADERTLKVLNTEAKHWPTDFSTAWERYMSQRSSSSIATPLVGLSLFAHIELFWERTIAFIQMHWALKNNDWKRILRVGTDYITTLNNYPNKVPHEYWHRLDNVLDLFDQSEEQKWEQHQSPYYPNTVAPPHPATSKPGPFVSCWKRTVAFTQIRLALRSGKIGRIVRVATEHMITLDRHSAKVPDEWWRQIDTAFDIFIALEAEYEDTDKDRNREQDIVAASQKLDELVKRKHPTPRLTMHEWRRIKIAIQHLANQKAQRIRDE